MRIRFICQGYANPVQDHERDTTPRIGERVELGGPDGPLSFVVANVHHIFHDVIPADVVIELVAAEPEESPRALASSAATVVRAEVRSSNRGTERRARRATTHRRERPDG